tara:strand:- start:122 stop:442 length:321 start_codon:yes stop_codon:yes gene_type:complete
MFAHPTLSNKETEMPEDKTLRSMMDELMQEMHEEEIKIATKLRDMMTAKPIAQIVERCTEMREQTIRGGQLEQTIDSLLQVLTGVPTVMNSMIPPPMIDDPTIENK